MITTVADFITAVNALSDIKDAYDIFEFECTEDVREEIYDLADPTSPEPFRNAMCVLGYTTY